MDKNYDWLDSNNDCDWLVMEHKDKVCKLIIRRVQFRLLRIIKNELVVIERDK